MTPIKPEHSSPVQPPNAPGAPSLAESFTALCTRIETTEKQIRAAGTEPRPRPDIRGIPMNASTAILAAHAELIELQAKAAGIALRERAAANLGQDQSSLLAQFQSLDAAGRRAFLQRSEVASVLQPIIQNLFPTAERIEGTATDPRTRLAEFCKVENEQVFEDARSKSAATNDEEFENDQAVTKAGRFMRARGE